MLNVKNKYWYFIPIITCLIVISYNATPWNDKSLIMSDGVKNE